MSGCAPRALGDSERPRRLLGASVRPLNFTVRLPMELFREFEKEVLRLLVTPHLGVDAVNAIERDAALVSLEHSGCGYFLTVKHGSVPINRVVCDKPIVSGHFHNTTCGFIAFMENGELMLECYSFGNESIPTDVRDLRVVVSTT